MKNFKFLSHNKQYIPQNEYLGFDMDYVLILVLRYIHRGNQITLNNDIALTNVNVPINNCWMRITDWRSLPSRNPARVEFTYRIIQANTNPINFNVSIEAEELMRAITN
jgi:hypothetical protein